ncbi:MAG: mandelate racemase/muconate lactonizing enzyme family protein [Candidatus Latescibacteria bacterium]|jgi:L-alanine-DL-glutamate epimerase-like enolase superfamily enzyme|nr:mandelate racemase/muconate lactonizing enzyme family protein [Candidatus Latescibacterota bacterium]
MKITDLKIDIHRREPSPIPKRDALQALPGSGSVRVTLETDDGITGTGDSGFGRIAGAPDALAAIIEHELKPVVIGQNPNLVRGLHGNMLRETEYHGSFGLAMFGIAAIDTAIWDCLGKARGVPCWQLWGGVHQTIRAYAMVGWLNYSDTEVCDICNRAVEQGFRAVKIKVGYPTLKEDIARIKTVRSAVGENIDIMVDANQTLTAAEATVRGRAFEDLNCLWWEEPLPADDIEGYAQLADALTIPIATGENLYTAADFARFFKHNALDIVQPDLRRAGGPTALLQVGHMADAFRIPYASHGGGPVQLNIMACLPNAMYLETGLISEGSSLKIKDGYVNIPHGPGFSWE